MKSICVYCGSSFGKDPAYKDGAVRLGQVLAQSGIALVYGGGRVGLMGVIADAVMDNGGKVTGVIPRFMEERELSHPNLTNLVSVGTMHERKAKMAELADGFIAMPGGFGTFEEIFEIITWEQLRIHKKPFAFYNIKGYYDSLHGFIDSAIDEGFIGNVYREIIYSDNPNKIIEGFINYHPSSYDKVSSSLEELLK
jgi:uncharacterized protein (TIGR00730 family)